MIWQSIQYDFPTAALLLFALPLIIWAFISIFRFRKQKLEPFANEAVVNLILVKRQPAVYWIKVVLFCLTWIFAIIALMQPKGNERYISGNKEQSETNLKTTVLRKKIHDVIFLIDASASMGIKDTPDGISREEVAKKIVDEIISKLKGENVSLYAFTSATIQIVPSTTDYLFTRMMLENVDINEDETSGTDIQQALEELRRNYFRTPNLKVKTLVLLTDGGDTRLEGLDKNQEESVISSILKPVEAAEDQHLHVFIVGIGSKQGGGVPGVTEGGQRVVSKLNERLLHRLSIASQGQFYNSNETSYTLLGQEIADQIVKSTGFEDFSDQTKNGEDLPLQVYDLYFQWPLGIALLLLSFFILIPDTRKQK